MPHVTPEGMTYDQLPTPTEQEWAALPNPPTITREDYKKNLGLIGSMKKWAANITAKMSGMSLKTKDYDDMKRRVQYFEEQERYRRRHPGSSAYHGPRVSCGPEASANRWLQRSQSTKRPKVSQSRSQRRRVPEDAHGSNYEGSSKSKRDHNAPP